MIVEEYLKQFENIDPKTEMKNILIYKNQVFSTNDLIRFKCSEKTPNKPGIYLAYEQFDPTDRYLVYWTGKKWVHSHSRSDICFGSKGREDYWSELTESFNE